MSSVNNVQIDRLLTEAARILEGRMFPEPPPREKLQESYALPEEYDRRVISFAREAEKTRGRKRKLKILLVVAAIVSLMIAFAMCMGAKEKFLFYMNSIYVDRHGTGRIYTQLVGDVQAGGEYVSETCAGYVPEGFVLDSEYRGVPGEYRYVNGERSFTYIRSTDNNTCAVDTENHDLKQMQINDFIVYYYEDEEQGYVFMTGSMPYCSIVVRGNLSVEECVEIFAHAN